MARILASAAMKHVHMLTVIARSRNHMFNLRHSRHYGMRCFMPAGFAADNAANLVDRGTQLAACTNHLALRARTNKPEPQYRPIASTLNRLEHFYCRYHLTRGQAVWDIALTLQSTASACTLHCRQFVPQSTSGES